MNKAIRMTADAVWQKISCPKKELQLSLTLVCGQSFRWKELKPGQWTSVLAGHVWTLKQTDDALYYRVHTVDKENPVTVTETREKKCKTKPIMHKHRHSALGHETLEKDFRQILWDYFQLDVNVSDLYIQWSIADPNFRSKAKDFMGVRILRQDPVENLFSFICSSNNNISRISLMVEKMCKEFGEPIGTVDGIFYYSFPTVARLADESVEERLRHLGFGYRAKYISKSARYIMDNHSTEWLYSLRSVPYEEAKCELMKLCGVGAKVADCVCLMSLDKHGAIPVDTHVWQIVNRDYKPPQLSNTKTITDTVYKQIGDFLRNLWGDYAGWAHSVLFSADLKKFKDKKSASKRVHSKTSPNHINNKFKRKKKL